MPLQIISQSFFQAWPLYFFAGYNLISARGSDMKRSHLFFFLLTVSVATWILPVSVSAGESTRQQRQTVLNIINELLLFHPGALTVAPSSSSSNNGLAHGTHGNNPGSQGLGGSAGGIQITIAGPGGRQILVQTSEGLLFNLTKVSSSGSELSADSREWACLKDNITGLIWEKKTSDGGMHDQRDSFAWYNTDPASNGGAEGFADNSGATCDGYVAGDPSTYCNTQAFVRRVNTTGYCGYKNWRMPTVEELEGIVSLNRVAPAIYRGFFPRGTAQAVWTASVIPRYPGFAWHVYLNDGYSHGIDRSGNLPVLLVHNGQN